MCDIQGVLNVAPAEKWHHKQRVSYRVYRLRKRCFRLVGARRFELLTFCTPSKRATSLRYAPKKAVKSDGVILLNWSERYHVAGGAVNWHLIRLFRIILAQLADFAIRSAEINYPDAGTKLDRLT